MSTPKPVYLANASVSMSYGEASKSLEELIFEGVTRALAACKCDMEDVDSVVLASHDLVDGRSLSSMVTAPAAGAYLRDEIRLAEDGLSAFALAAAKVAAGESRRCVVAAWGRASEGDFKRRPLACMDPFLEQSLGITEAHVSALRYSRWLSAYGMPGSAKDRAAAARQARAARNAHGTPSTAVKYAVPWPLDERDAPPRSDIVAATVLCAEPQAFLVAGIGQETDLPRLGDRDWLAQTALGSSARRALHEAGCKFFDMEAIELDALTLSEEAMAIEALGLADGGRGFEAYEASERLNRSGGSAAGWCYPAMGLVRLADVVQAMHEGARKGIAIGSGPIGRQVHTSVVLEKA